MGNRFTSRPLPPRDRRYSAVVLMLLALAGCGGFYTTSTPGMCVAVIAFLGCAGLAVNMAWGGIPIFAYDRILSARSTDGVNWDKEQGLRLDVGGRHQSCQVYSPWVVETADGHRMYYRAGGYDSIIASAFSTDGLQWSEEEGVRIDHRALGMCRVDSPCVLSVGDGTWAMYYAGMDGAYWRIYRSISTDGLQWSRGHLCVDLARTSALHPCVVASGGEFRMFFTRATATEGAFSTSLSTDGLCWETPLPCAGYKHREYRVRNPHVQCGEDGSWPCCSPSTVLQSSVPV